MRLCGCQTTEPHDARIRPATHKDKFVKILVLSDEHPIVVQGDSKQRLVRRIRMSVAGGEHLLPEINQSPAQDVRCRTGVA